MKQHDETEGFALRESTGPLSGVLIADFSRILAGPYCSMFLADLGATVIKVESRSGDDTRTWKPPVSGDDSTYFLSVNRNKQSIVLDFTDDNDRALARELAGRADVVLENFRPGTLDRFGLDYESLAAENPRLVYASITGFGTQGGRALPGYDLLVQAVSGMMSITGEAEHDPTRAGVAVFDVVTGLHTCIGILAALRHVEATGVGQRVETNLLSSALSGMVNQTAAYVNGGVIPQRMGNAHPSIYPYEPMPTEDGWIVIAVGNDGQFQKLCGALEGPELAQDPLYATAYERNQNRGQLAPLLNARFALRGSAEWFEVLTAAGVPCAPIQDVRGGVDLASQLGLEPVVTIDNGGRSVPTVRNPLTFSSTPPSYDLAPPALGADSELIRHWLANPRVAGFDTHAGARTYAAELPAG